MADAAGGKTTAKVVVLLCAAFLIGVGAGWGVESVAAQGSQAVQGGQKLFEEVGCARCHYTDSREQRVGPGLAGLFDRDVLPASGKPVTEENVRHQIVSPFDEMPSFEDRLDAQQIDAIIAYLKTL